MKNAKKSQKDYIFDNCQPLSGQIEFKMQMALLFAKDDVAPLNGKMVKSSVACLYHVLAAVEMMRKLADMAKGSGSAEKQAATQRTTLFREYFTLSGLHLRYDMTTQRIVELHLGPQGLATWNMLQALGYSPSQDDFWIELNAYLAAHSSDTVENIDCELFVLEA